LNSIHFSGQSGWVEILQQPRRWGDTGETKSDRNKALLDSVLSFSKGWCFDHREHQISSLYGFPLGGRIWIVPLGCAKGVFRRRDLINFRRIVWIRWKPNLNNLRSLNSNRLNSTSKRPQRYHSKVSISKDPSILNSSQESCPTDGRKLMTWSRSKRRNIILSGLLSLYKNFLPSSLRYGCCPLSFMTKYMGTLFWFVPFGWPAAFLCKNRDDRCQAFTVPILRSLYNLFTLPYSGLYWSTFRLTMQ
jgi:hypothetical protein